MKFKTKLNGGYAFRRLRYTLYSCTQHRIRAKKTVSAIFSFRLVFARGFPSPLICPSYISVKSRTTCSVALSTSSSTHSVPRSSSKRVSPSGLSQHCALCPTSPRERIGGDLIPLLSDHQQTSTPRTLALKYQMSHPRDSHEHIISLFSRTVLSWKMTSSFDAL